MSRNSYFVDEVELVTEECCNCHMTFAMTADFKRRKRNNRNMFYCPAGHPQHYTGKSEEEKLRDQLNRERGRSTMLEDQRDRISRSYNRMRERVKNGLCPCCNRTFQNLLAHMRSKHPDFGDHKVLRTMRDIFGLTQSTVADEIGVPVQYISRYENKKPIPEHVESSIQGWIDAAGGG